MSDKWSSGNPLFDMWMESQRQFISAQQSLVTSLAGGAPAEPNPAAAERARENWEICEKQFGDWLKASSRWLSALPGEDGQSDSVVDETLRRMMDPSRFFSAGLDEVGQAIRRLVEGPEFADIGALERQVLTATKEWLSLREASALYSSISAAAWSRAFTSFSSKMASGPETFSRGPRAVMNLWLEIANEELIRTQRTDEFLDAQRALLRAGMDYRIKERELIEVWCESRSMPTRTEIDDLHKTVYELRRQVRALTQQLKAVEQQLQQRPSSETSV